ncbi:hypothetical protein OF001_U10169 [Pseudomonas sp. OF001]|nr:hypothetical protein OF001_U10169 [Pseudomonas sp. OF001]
MLAALQSFSGEPFFRTFRVSGLPWTTFVPSG